MIKEAYYEDGVLVTIYNDKMMKIEEEVFRLICMKYGPQWSLLNLIMPWRSKANWRSTWIHITKQQAISEWCGVRGDPYKLGEIFRPMCHKGFENDKFIYKKRLVNKNEMISKEERDSTKEQNMSDYGLSDEEASRINVPLILNANYLTDSSKMNKIILTLKLQQAKVELAKRKEIERPSTSFKILQVGKGNVMKLGKRKTIMNFTDDTSDFLFELNTSP